MRISYWTHQKFHGITIYFFIPSLIKEVADFKSLIKGYIEELVELKEMHIIKFFMDNHEWYVFNTIIFALHP